MSGDEPIRVLVVDDHAVLRTGLRMWLGAQPDMVVVGEAGCGDQAVNLAAELAPDVILMDLSLPRISGGANRVPNGLETIRRITANRPEVRILALTMHDDPGYLRAVLEAGGCGYVLKRAADTDLLAAIRAVRHGGTYLHPEHLQLFVAGPPARPAVDEPVDHAHELLSSREQEVLRLIAWGHTNQQVADKLCLSVKTVETYRHRLMAKLGMACRADLVRYAIRHRLLEGEE